MRFILFAVATCVATAAFAQVADAQVADAQVADAQDANTQPAGPNAALDAQELDEAARLLFESGTRSYDNGDFDEALGRYTTAYELSGRSALLYNIAICHDRLEHKEEAATFYERFLAENPDSPRAGVSRSRAAILRASLAGSGGTIVDDGDVEPNDTEPVGESAPPVAEPRSSRSLAGPIASFAVGGAGLITFAVAAGLSSSRLSACEDTPCDTDGLDAVDRASLVADIGLGVAIAGAAVGVIWWLVGRDSDDETEARTHLVPAASPSTLGAQLMGSF